MDEKTVMDALVQMKRIGNLLNEVEDLTQQLAQAIDRNDQVSTSMLIGMRAEPLQFFDGTVPPHPGASDDEVLAS